MKILKVILTGIAGLIVLIIVGIAVLVARFDPNKFKSEAIQIVRDRTQRSLTIDGDIKLAFFPAIGVELGKLSLSEPKGSKTFAEVSSAKISVELLPLLSRQVIANRVSIDGLTAHLARQKDGSSNFDDLLGKPDPGKARKDGVPAANIDIGGIDITNTNLDWTDAGRNQRFAVKNLQLKTGRIAGGKPSKFEISMGVSGDNPKIDVNIRASGSLSLDLEAAHYKVTDLSAQIKGSAAGIDLQILEAKGALDLKPDSTGIEALVVKFAGKRGGDSVEANLDVPNALVAKDTLRAAKVSLAAKFVQAQGHLNATLVIPGIEGSGNAFKAGDLKLDLDGKHGDNTVKGTLASPITGNVGTQRFELPKLIASVNITGPGMPKGAAVIGITGNAAMDLARKAGQLNFTSKIDESNINAKLALSQFSPPTLQFDVNIDQLNVDKYLPPKSAEQPATTTPEKPIDLSGLKSANASGSIKIGALQASNIKAANIVAQVKLANGRLEVGPHSGSLYQGNLSGSLSADANGNRIAIRENLTGIAIGPLLRDAAGKDLLDGRGNVAIDVTSAGNTVGAMRKALSGTAKLELKDGSIKGIDLAETFRKAKSALGAKGAAEQGANKQEKTEFSEMSASFVIKNGIAHNSDLSAKSPFLRLSGDGDINIGDNSMDYLAKAAVVASAGGQGGKDLGQLKGLTVPVRLSGPFDALKYRIEFGSMLSDAVKEKAKDAVKGIFGEKFGIGAAKPDAQKADVKDQAKDALKGLFKR